MAKPTKTKNNSLNETEIELTITGDVVTNDFDLKAEKKPALSTMTENFKQLEKRTSTKRPATTQTVQQFDKLKLVIDLAEHWQEIELEFNLENSNMIEAEYPYKPQTKVEYNLWLLKHSNGANIRKKSNNKSTSFKDDNNGYNYDFSEFEDDDDEELDYYNDIEDEIEADTHLKGNIEQKNKTDRLSNQDVFSEPPFPNCKILYSHLRQGLRNVYIEDNKLFIYVTGKYNSSSESLGYLTIENIRDVIDDVCFRAGFSFNVNQFLQLAGICLCDVCIDLPLKNVAKTMLAISSLFPLATSRHKIMKYGRHGLKLKSKAKKCGSSLTFYNKGKEIRQRVHRIFSLYENEYTQRGITELDLLAKYPKGIDNIMRVEVQMYTLQEIRNLMNIEKQENRLVRVIDVLNSIATPILKNFEAFGATEKVLKAKIWGYVKSETSSRVSSPTKVRNRLAGERLAQLVQDNSYDIIRTRNHLIIEYEIDKESVINGLTTEIKSRLWDFLLYQKPKAIKQIISLLNKVHIAYGREAGADNE